MALHHVLAATSLLLLLTATARPADDVQPLDIGARRELFVDQYLIDTMHDVRLVLHTPRDEGIAVKFDQPWEGPFCGYCTVIHDGAVVPAVLSRTPDRRARRKRSGGVLLRGVGGWCALDKTGPGAVRSGRDERQQRRAGQRRAGHSQFQSAVGHAARRAAGATIQGLGRHDGKRPDGLRLARRDSLDSVWSNSLC